jgi:adenosylcobinamide amidohydrolase
MTVLHHFTNGDALVRRGGALIVRFDGRRDVLSTSAMNGGFQRDLRWAFNHDCKVDGRKDAALKAPTYAQHLAVIATELGLDPAYACGLSTAADMENVSVESETYEELTVTAAVTRGIDENGGRAGDPAVWHERDGESVPVGGTINILLHIDARLTEGAMARALVTCTEAKTAALQELLAPSLYSSGIATGSGTDGTVVVSDPGAQLQLTYAGKHSKLGELIGRAVLKAVKRALYLQTGLGPAQQFDVFARIGRFGITKEDILRRAHGGEAELDSLAKQPGLVTLTSLYVHLLDQLEWGLLSPPTRGRGRRAPGAHGHAGSRTSDASDAAGVRERMLGAYARGLAGHLNSR